jgi:hypothetical protein
VGLDGVEGEVELVSDLGVAEALGQLLEYPYLGVGKRVGQPGALRPCERRFSGLQARIDEGCQVFGVGVTGGLQDQVPDELGSSIEDGLPKPYRLVTARTSRNSRGAWCESCSSAMFACSSRNSREPRTVTGRG